MGRESNLATVQRSVSAGDATEGDTAAKAVLSETALRLTSTVQARYDLAMIVHHLRPRVRPQASERIMQDRGGPGGVERGCLDLVHGCVLPKIRITSRIHEGIVFIRCPVFE